jgi:hypothetical protein
VHLNYILASKRLLSESESTMPVSCLPVLYLILTPLESSIWKVIVSREY